MLTPPPDMYPGCTWADQPVTATTPYGIGTAATIDPRTGLTTRYVIHAFNPHTSTVLVVPDQREDRAGVVRRVPEEQRTRRSVVVRDLDELRLVHRRTRDDATLLHTNHCRHALKTAFVAGGPKRHPIQRRTPGGRREHRPPDL